MAHSSAMGYPLVVTNLTYSSMEGTNVAIYLQADTANQLFQLQEAPRFTLWQLPSQGGGQMMSYVIQTAGGKLMVVDGGRTEDGSYLKNFLAARGNHVDHWFISHPHQDHIDALTWILANQGDLIIDEIYAAIPPTEWMDLYYDSNAKSGVQAFTNALANAGRSYVELNAGDLFDIDEVHVEVLFAGNTDLSDASENIYNPGNNYSAVMRVSDLTKSVLFTGDIGKDAGDYLVDTLDPAKLKADYVQMAHHGQYCAEKNFYELVEAKYALWPAPLWLWDNDQGDGFDSWRLTTIETRQWMDELGVVQNYVSGLSGLIEIK
jgi:beta-lactamase superfamily II metal-dependent hydrolase